MRTFQSIINAGKIGIFFFIAFVLCPILYGQLPGNYFIKGNLGDMNNEPVQFATAALLRLPDSILVTGVASDTEGNFTLGPVTQGKYRLIISAIGYVLESRDIDLTNNYDAGNFKLNEKSISLGEIIVSGERKKAGTDVSKTTYFVSSGLTKASYNASDLISYIPGIQVDLMKNISVKGSQNVIIMVNGSERDRNYLGQLDASQIDKIEVNDSPGAEFDAGTSGVINIVLKKDKESGITGYLNAETPTSASEIFIFPSYSLGYSTGKFNLYTSYNGEMTYLNVIATGKRIIENSNRMKEIDSYQELRQKYWSNRFHYGIDYTINEKNLLSLYANYNPYSRELDGKTSLVILQDNSEEVSMSGKKDDKDLNKSFFYSLYFRHAFNNTSRYIEFDISDYHFSSQNGSIISFDNGQNIINSMRPVQRLTILKTVFVSPLSTKLNLNAGLKARLQKISDDRNTRFNYSENILAGYCTLAYNTSKYAINLGLRSESSLSGQDGKLSSNLFSLIPDASLLYRIASQHNLKLSYARTVKRPGLYELNPAISNDDPFSVKSGNPSLMPEFLDNIALSYSGLIKDQFMSFQLYYLKRSDVIGEYTFKNDSELLETLTGNMGRINNAGLEMSGSVRLFGLLTLNPYLNIYHSSLASNCTAEGYGITYKEKWAFRLSFSAIANFKYDISASVRFQYDNLIPEFQGTTFSDPLYFVSVEKIFFKKFQFGIKTALPFTGSFIYEGSDIEVSGFSSHSEGIVRLSSIPLWLNFSYHFSSGKKVNTSERTREEISNKQKKGF